MRLKEDRSLLIFILLNAVTFGIYGIVFYYGLVNDINTIAGRYDGKQQMNYILVLLLSVVTCGIFGIIWFHTTSDRIGNELRRRNIGIDFSATTFWLWFVVGGLIVVGPIIYLYKMFGAMNALSSHFNANGGQ